MLRFYSSVVFLLIFQTLFSQEIYIPYRDGKLWGICNENGEIIIKPQYDKVEFDNGYDAKSSTIYTFNKDKKGLIVNGKIIANSIYDRIYTKNNIVVLIQDGKSTELITPEGKPVLNFPIVVADIHNLKDNLLLFEVVHPDYTESIFTLNEKNYAIEQWLYKNYYSLDILKTRAEFTSINAKKTANGGLVTESWNFSKTPVEKAPQNQNIWQVKYADKFASMSKKYRDKYHDSRDTYSEYGSGSGTDRDIDNDIVMVESVKGDPDQGGDYMGQKTVSKTVSGYAVFTNVNTKAAIDLVWYNTPNTKASKTLPYKDFEIVNASYKYKNQDTLITCSNFLKIKNNAKQGLILINKPFEPIYFDSISKKQFYYYNNLDNGTSIVVGKKFNSKLKYNLFLLSTTSTSSNWYDEIKEISNINYKGKCLLVKNDTKYGLIATNGDIILNPEYDTIDFNNQKSTYDENYTYIQKTKKGSKYGAIYLLNGSIKLVEPNFDYPVATIYTNYPNQNNRTYYSYSTNKVQNTIQLLTLKDDRGNLIGYANANGMLYYKN